MRNTLCDKPSLACSDSHLRAVIGKTVVAIEGTMGNPVLVFRGGERLSFGISLRGCREQLDAYADGEECDEPCDLRMVSFLPGGIK